MTTASKARSRYAILMRNIHKVLAPILLLPVVLTLLTGMVYQVVDLAGMGDRADWLLDVHKGHFGAVNLELIYPFLIGLGLLGLSVTGIQLWLHSLRKAKQRIA